MKIAGIGEKNITMMNNLDKMFPNIMMNPSLEPNSMVGNNHISFYSNGIEIDKSKTLKENNIEDNAIILFGYSNIKPVNVNFISNIPQIYYLVTIYIFFHLLKVNYMMNIQN